MRKNSLFPVLFVAVAQLLLLSYHMAFAAVPGETAPAVTSADADSISNISIDFKDADIKTVLRVMSLKSKVNIVAGPEVQGVVTIRLENVPWEKALEVVLRTYGYVYERDENIIRVTTRENLATEPLTTQTFILNYTKAEEIKKAVQDMLTDRGRVQVAERTNTIVISDIPTNLYRIGEVIKKLDKRTPQAFIDSKVIKTNVGFTENLGIEWKTGGSQNLLTVSGSGRPTTFPFRSDTGGDKDESIGNAFREFFPIATGTSITANTNDNRSFPFPALTSNTAQFTYGTLDFSSFSSVLQLLRSRSNTKVVSNPRIVVLNNQTAKVQVGEQIPIPTFERNETTGSLEVTGFSFRDVGVVMNVTPHINSEEEILVDLAPEVSSQNGTLAFTSTLAAPKFTITTAKTQVLIRSGQTIAIGGLMTDNTQIAEAKVPYLGDIPFVGKLFRSKRQTAGSGNEKVETLFFVTVTMVDTEGQPVGGKEQKDKDKTAKDAAAQANTATPNPEKVEAANQSQEPAQTEPATVQAERTANESAATPAETPASAS